MSETKSAPQNFGLAIAFVAPGFLGFVALSYFSPMASDWLQAASKEDQGVGVFLFVLLGSIALGIVISGIRALLIDRLLHSKLMRGWKVSQPSIQWDKMDDQKREALNTLIEGFYRYYQFYSNSLIALLLLLVARLCGDSNPLLSWWSCAALLIVGVCLFWSARDSYRKYCEATVKLFN
ncbi:MAG: hypothetical protein JSU04_04190 [Bdellovibrionales bacterium]|nr:hypothetical protein [Bdellovibrionales bacterium]